MTLTLVSHFTARPTTADVLKQCLLSWEDGVRRLSDISIVEAAQRFISSDGDLSSPCAEGIISDKFIHGSRKMLGLLFEGTLLLQGDCAVKTKMVMRFGDSEFTGEIYVTMLNFPQGKPIEKKFFSLWSILYGNIIKESTPFTWTSSAPRILLDQTPLHWILRIINYQRKFLHVDTMEVRSAENAVTEAVNKAAPNAETAVIETSTNVEADSPEAESSTATESETSQDIAKLQEQLEKYKSENEELSEKNEQLTNINRDLKKNQKTYIQNIEEQKKRLRVLKKRADSAEARAKEAARGDVKEFCEHFDQELERLETEATEKNERINQLTLDLDTANGKITSLKGRLNKQNMGNGIYGLLAAPENEGEKYENEFGIAILSALHKAIDKTPTKNNSPHTRSIDVWQAIIDANPDLEKAFEQYCNDTKALKNATVGGELDKKKHLLKPFNLDFNDHHNNHGRISFGSDDRYIASTASTASETASGFSNCAKDLRNTFLFPT